MKHILLCTLSLLLLASSAFAQNARIHHRITQAHNEAPQMGRDLWFTLLTNYGIGNLPGKYFALYVTSPNTTTVHVQLTGVSPFSILVQPYKMTTFNMPLAWEMHTSGIVGDFGVHVWSNDADISAYVMSHNPQTSDGMYVIPTIGWGTEYVVAGYAAIGVAGADEPSEFGIVANQDNTRVTITPATDLRLETSVGGCPNCLLAAKGTSFQVVLNKGQSVQYKGVQALDCDNFDVTGTIITSDKNIGVVAGSMCTNIPCEFPYCDHVLDMLPPVRTWARTYYSLPFYQPAGAALSHQASTFLVVATKPGQIIYRYDNVAGIPLPAFTSSQTYDFLFLNDVTQGSRWFSDDPFLLVQYINSATYPDNVNGQGDPAEVVVNSSEQFTKTVVFCTPVSLGSQSPYTNYVNIVARSNDKNVRFDGQPVLGLHQVYIDGIYTGYRASNIAPGGHIVASDSGVGVYIYGYGYGESYAWTGSYATGTFNSADTTPPVADTSGACFQAHVNLTDLLNGGDSVVGLNYIRIDSIYNMGVTLDPNWVEGRRVKTSYYDMIVPDVTKSAILVVSAFDQAGNRTMITSTYSPQDARLAPPLQDFGVGNPSSCIIMYDTIINSLTTPYAFNSIKLVRGNQGFTIDSTLPSSPLAVGSANMIKICFKAQQGSIVFDTLQVDDGCVIRDVVLTGTGGAPDFRITGHDWGTQLLGMDVVWDGTQAGGQGSAIEVVNTSPNQPITIDSMWVDDPVHFIPTKDSHWATSANPIILSGGVRDIVTYTFHTALGDTLGRYTTQWHARGNQLSGGGDNGIRSNILTANVVAPGESFTADTTDTLACPRPNNDSVGQQFVLTATGNATSVIKSIVHTNPYFTYFTVTRDNGSVVSNPTNMSEVLTAGQRLNVTESFIAVQSMGGTSRDSIYAYSLNQADGTQQLIGGRPLIATMIVSKCSDDVQPTPRGAALPACASLFPNPAENAATLRYSLDKPSDVTIELLTILGSTVHREEYREPAGEHTRTLDLSTLPNGIYVYRMAIGGEVASGNIVIAR